MTRTVPTGGASPAVGPVQVPRWLFALSAVSIAGAGAWTFWPLSQHVLETPVLGSPSSSPASPRLALNLDAFAAPIWVEEAPPAPTPERRALAPLRLQLLAILHEQGAYRAMLYDPDSDRLLVVAAGESAGGRMIESVQADSVAVRDGELVRTLALAEQPGGAP